MSLKNQISKLIGDNDADEALNVLRNYIQSYSDHHVEQYSEHVVQLSSRLDKIKSDDIAGLLTQEQASVKMAKWNQSVLGLTNLIHSGKPIPKKKKKKNTLFYVFGLIAFLGGSYFVWDMMTVDENAVLCPDYSENIACKLLVSDFNYDKDDFANINQLISDEINSNPDLNRVIESKFSNSLDDIKNGNQISDSELIEKCNYDYRVFGSLLKSSSGNRLSISILPKMTFEIRSFKSTISDLAELADQIQAIDVGQLDTSFIISKVCLACAMKSDDVMEQLVVVAEKFDKPEKKQLLLNSLVTVSLVKQDTVRSLELLDEISSATNNDFALGAIEEKVSLLSEKSDFSNAFRTQTNFIEAIEARIQTPTKFRTKHSSEKLKSAQSAMRYKRGINVIKNYQLLKRDKSLNIDKVYKRALHDFKILQQANYENNAPKMDRHIQELIGLRKPNTIPEPQIDDDVVMIPITPPEQKMTKVYGKVYSCKGGESIKFKIGNHQFNSSKNGSFSKSFMAFVDDTLEIKSEQWDISKKYIILDRVAKKIIFKVSPKNGDATIREKGIIINREGKPIGNAIVSINQKRALSGKKGDFGYSWEKTYCDKDKKTVEVSIKAKGYESYNGKLLLGNNKPWKISLERAKTTKLIKSVSGTVTRRGCAKSGFPRIYANGQPLKIDKRGRFSEDIGKPSAKIQYSVKDRNWKLTDDFYITGRGTQIVIEFTPVRKKITGRLLDAKKQPLIGANVILKGTSIGTVTDFDGNFSLNAVVTPCSVLEASFIGSSSKKVSIQKHFSNSTKIDLGRIYLN